ncbi:RNA 3'-terminal phosphate cyclase [Cryptotermes secundus]|uniref:RNA 3'-terminal phosphate cyclase n=1 Tax=Cryptotermes secundus TaxID=105785 RepID=A0A2J7QQA6_9NEOP|nr:RNA 3'-terminal phosphate cyclase isoform X1 [Cryptotermes secundus]XP_023710588.1 RNA 3'-terminal phosphate cyclase isoform X1 [Cryptotermes secundus]XP_023710589.1 RNA 3'-terminal phosphate cyclase isoform X1 [Cryptotermes secundus]PNF30765.1 RNA 3'-terminal phosphate cyclase [Cryptotermes secundus]PNF30766.1 RNA 3'-terminal phosphate cyclase [Cryptotermes secundus]PNF30767.1 RNA 3'-terminal phosphate cyclase [Cryptotermes secundus]
MAGLVTDIDGGMLEGGGQILRMALAFSVLKKKPVRVFNIRAGRSNPGLRAQHLKGVEVVRDISEGKLKGGEIGSTEIVLHPGKVKCGEYSADTGTAGSICLLIQVALPCILFSSGVTILKLRGGTNAEMAPQIDYMTEVFRPLLERFGGTFDYKIITRGYYPRGGGEVHIRVKPVKQLKAIDLVESGDVVRIWGWAFVAGSLPIKLAHLMADSAIQTLRKALKNVDVKIERYVEHPDVAVGTGSGINLVAETSTGCLLGGSALGKRELKPEQVGHKAADELLQSINTKACVDSYSQDQIILFMAIAHGKSRVKCGPVTLHTETAIHVARQLTEAKFTVINVGTDSNIIECEGIGLENNGL